MDTVTVYQTNPKQDYTVFIDGHVYEMNSHADRPNGVNIYLGTAADCQGLREGKQVPLYEWPYGLCRGIRARRAS